MELKGNTDTLLKIGRIVADVLLGVECAFFLIFGIAGCVNISLVYLIMVFLGPAFSFASWIFERILIAIGHDVKMMRNSGTSMYAQSNSPSPAPAQESVESTKAELSTENATTESAHTAALKAEQTTSGDKIFCMNCGTENDVDSKFCGKCGNRLS